MSLDQVIVTSEVFLTCLTHALTTETEEIMGLLLGDVMYVDGKATAKIWRALPQIRTDRRKDRVECSAEQVAACTAEAERLAQVTGVKTRVVGWYHSHPHITVLPSHVDIRTQAMYQLLDQGFVGLIFSVFNKDTANQSAKVQVTAFQSVRSDPRALARIDSVELAGFDAATKEALRVAHAQEMSQRGDSGWEHKGVQLKLSSSWPGDSGTRMEDYVRLQETLLQEEQEAYQRVLQAIPRGTQGTLVAELHHAGVYQQLLCRLMALQAAPALQSLQDRLQLCKLEREALVQDIQMLKAAVRDAKEARKAPAPSNLVSSSAPVPTTSTPASTSPLMLSTSAPSGSRGNSTVNPDIAVVTAAAGTSMASSTYVDVVVPSSWDANYSNQQPGMPAGVPSSHYQPQPVSAPAAAAAAADAFGMLPSGSAMPAASFYSGARHSQDGMHPASSAPQSFPMPAGETNALPPPSATATRNPSSSSDGTTFPQDSKTGQGPPVAPFGLTTTATPRSIQHVTVLDYDRQLNAAATHSPQPPLVASPRTYPADPFSHSNAPHHPQSMPPSSTDRLPTSSAASISAQHSQHGPPPATVQPAWPQSQSYATSTSRPIVPPSFSQVLGLSSQVPAHPLPADHTRYSQPSQQSVASSHYPKPVQPSAVGQPPQTLSSPSRSSSLEASVAESAAVSLATKLTMHSAQRPSAAKGPGPTNAQQQQ